MGEMIVNPGAIDALNEQIGNMIEIESITLNPDSAGQGVTNIPSTKRILRFMNWGGIFAFPRTVNNNPNGYQLTSYSVANGTFAPRTESTTIDVMTIKL